MFRSRAPVRFRRCLAPARAFASMWWVHRAPLPETLPAVATSDNVWVQTTSEIRGGNSQNCQKWHARSSRPLAPGGRGNVQRVTFNFQLPPWRRCCEDGTPGQRAIAVPCSRDGRTTTSLRVGGRSCILHLASWIWGGVGGKKRARRPALCWFLVVIDATGRSRSRSRPPGTRRRWR